MHPSPPEPGASPAHAAGHPSASSPVDQAFQRYQETGEPRYLAQVFDSTATELLQVAVHLTRNVHDAEDLVQATYMLAILRRHEFQRRGSVVAWLAGILNKMAVSHYRANRRSAPAELLQAEAEAAAEDGGKRAGEAGNRAEAEHLGPLPAAQSRELSDAVNGAIGRLPEVYRPVLILHLQYGLNSGEIAHSLQRPAGTVRTQLVRGLELLRKSLPNSLIAGAVVLTTPVQGLSAIREVVLAKAAALTAADHAAKASFLFGLGKPSTLLLSAGILAAMACGLAVYKENGGGRISHAVFAEDCAQGIDKPATNADSNSDSAFHSSPHAVAAFFSPPDPGRITTMHLRTFTSLSSPQPSDVPVAVPVSSFSSLVLSTTLLLPALLPAQNPLFFFEGQYSGGSGESLGNSISPALDVNLDGYQDLLTGASLWSDPILGSYIGRAYIYSGQTGIASHTFTGEQADDRFGNSLSTAGDVNLDGFVDCLVGAHQWDDPTPKSDCGRLYLYSGKDGALLHTHQGGNASDRFSYSNSFVHDINLDGYPDYLTSAFGWKDPNTAGAAEGRMYLYSGKDNTLISTFQPEKASTQLGISVCVVSDVNLDGYADLVGGAYDWDDPNGGSRQGRIYVFSGKSHSLLFTYHGEQPNTQLGSSVSSASDLNGDGYSDILAGAIRWDDLNGAGSDVGRVYAISGQGGLLFTINGENASDLFSQPVSGGHDLDLDGYPEILTGAAGWDLVAGTPSSHGRVYLYSGADRSLLWTQNGENMGDSLGNPNCLLPDLNQDGIPDLAAGAINWDDPNNPTPSTFTNEGKVYVYSGTSFLPLTSDTHLLSISVASTQNLSLNGGLSHAGRQYWVFGNFAVSGMAPGVTLGAVNIPLNPDPWTQITIDFANTSALLNTKGALDGNGHASASLNSLAPQPSAPLGLTLQHCYLVYQSGFPDQYYMASNLVSWTTVP